MSDRSIRRALLSVSDKTGLTGFAQGLQALGVELISTGGTRHVLLAAGLPVKDIAEVTGFPEILDGRVKTLHPHIHAGLLARRDDPKHMATLEKHGIGPIDLVVSNLYPFEQAVRQPGVSEEEVVENIDIGGPTIVRAAGKNYQAVAVVTDESQYGTVLEELRSSGGKLSLATRRKLAAAAFAKIAAYDAAIANYFADHAEERFPPQLALQLTRRSVLRYGENPHQQAALYVEADAGPPSIAWALILHGKELSFNNILDLESALQLVRSFHHPAAVVIKHNNPCGAAQAATLADAFRMAYDGDPLSAYGGVFGFNRELDSPTAEQLVQPQRFVEAIMAPSYTPGAWEMLTSQPKWKDSVRLLQTGPLTPPAEGYDFRCIEGGMLAQTRDIGQVDWSTVKVPTKRAPTLDERVDLEFAWNVVKHVKSNAIVLAQGGMVVGVGAGQMSRVDAVQIAVRKAGERAKGSVLASDAFFPFRDNIDEAAKAGITALVQPGGSIRDKDSIQACDDHGIAMVLTGMRHFRH
jgi:phosphoribosylaminoimidazolecarboxamide formyltransferase / IMP cyclohydrolase